MPKFAEEKFTELLSTQKQYGALQVPGVTDAGRFFVCLFFFLNHPSYIFTKQVLHEHKTVKKSIHDAQLKLFLSGAF